MPSRTPLLNTPRLLLLLLTLAACLSDLSAQTTTPQDRGFQPGGSYAAGDIETINLQGGNLMINLPLAALPAGRGGLGAKLTLTYNSKIWDELVNDPQNHQCPSGATCAPPPPATSTLVESPEGGWNYAFQYQLQVDTRDYNLPTSYNPSLYNPCNDSNAVYYYRLMVRFPDGGKHEFKLQGQQDSNGYYKYKPDGRPSSWCSSTQPLTGTLNYYTTDGTYMRLEVAHDSDANWSNNPWTLYLPDGGRVTGGNAAQRIYDRNDNYVEVQSLSADPAYSNHVTVKLVDQVGRKVVLEYGSGVGQDSIHAWGVNNVEMVTTVKWKDIYVYKSYRPGAVSYFKPTGLSPMRVVDFVTLPAQSGGLQYTFGYNPGASNPSYGWGELNSVTLPTGATTAYQYSLDGQDQVYTSNVITSRPTRKDLTYQQEYDGVTTPVTETWLYSKSAAVVTMTAPNGGVTTETFSGGYSKRTESPDGTVVERDWQRNSPFGATYFQFGPGPAKDNYYVRSEYTSIRNAVGALVKTAIKDFNYDKNGNVTSVKEYDWVDWASVHDGSGNPVWTATRPAVVRRTDTGYFNDTPDASDSSTDDPDVYHKATAPRKHDSARWSEVKDPALPNPGVLARTEFTYDDPATHGNVTVKKSWDSTKGACSDPLTSSNSISVSTQYDGYGYGNPTLVTDANGRQTKLTYGPVGGVPDLYPTMTETAYGAIVERTAAVQYDFWTGLMTLSTDVDNNVSTSTSYDVFGRPTLVKGAVGTSDESRVQTIYDDDARRVVVRSDLNAAGDGKLVSVNHYDQLGRVRLTRRLEDASAQSETDEEAGIKVQTRYKYAGTNSHVLVSNPYRSATSAAAGGEGTMGWTLTTSDRGGRKVRSESFGGTGLPAPWGTNSSSTGLILTSYAADSTTVTEPTTSTETTLRERRSVTDGLGRLAKVYEDPSGSNHLTSYTYDALGNLTGVSQGSQTRSFVYSSLSRLVSATNPEECQQQQAQCVPVPVTYEYDPKGNVKKKTDARGVAINYLYDALDRITSTSYSNESTHTPDVTYSYDNPAGTYAKGRLWKTETTGVAATVFDTYDALGRPKKYHQSFSSNGVYGPNYDVQYTYNKAGAVTSQTYPSGHSVSYSYDAAGRLGDSGAQPAFSGNLGDGVLRTYASQVLYAPLGGVSQERFGADTPVYNKHLFNSRGQLAEIRVSTYSITAAGHETDWNRGAIINHYSKAAGAWGATGGGPDNNGNLKKQDIYIPNDDAISGYSQSTQFYDYDALNRLYQARESYGGPNIWVQYFNYDRWGNRTINAANTTGSAPEPQFSVDASTNRLGVPTGQSGAMSYDVAGNLTNDTYQGGGARTYDAENRMTGAQFVSGQLQTAAYTYVGDGRRIKRSVGAGGEVWQVYGAGGELLAEYAAGAAPASPQKEYGYRSGELLVTADASAAAQTNLALGKTATQSSTYGAQGAAGNAVDGVTSGGLTHTNLEAQAWWQVDLGAIQQIDTVKLWSRLDCCQDRLSNFYVFVSDSPFTSNDLNTTLNQPGVSNYYVAGQAPSTLSQAVGRTGRYVRVQLTGTNYLSLREVEVFGLPNIAAGKPATQSSTYPALNLDAGVAVDGSTTNFTHTNLEWRPWWQVDLGSVQSLSAVRLWNRPDCCQNRLSNFYILVSDAPFQSTDLNATLAQSGVTAYYVPGQAPVVLTQLVGRTARYVRVQLNGTDYLSLSEVQVLGTAGGASGVQWLVADQLGTPRMVVDKTGSLSGVQRHDYFPFGEEIPGDQNWRTPPRGYGGDTLRQKFAGEERDGETGLDYLGARFYASKQGRFTSADPFGPWAMTEGEKLRFLSEPQQWNRYSYVTNNPLKYTDPTGMERYAEGTDPEHQRKLHEALLRLAQTGTTKQKELANFILNNDVTIRVVENLQGHGHADYSDAEQGYANTQKAINGGTLTMSEAAKLITIDINKLELGGPFGIMRSDPIKLTGLLAHEGQHAFDLARVAQGLSDPTGPNGGFNPTQFRLERDGFAAEAEYYYSAQGSGGWGVGRQKNMIDYVDRGGGQLPIAEVSEVGIRKILLRPREQGGYNGLNVFKPGKTQTERTRLKPRK